MSNEGGGNEGPERTDFQKSKEVPDCGAHCEHIHGDQAPSAEDVVIASLQREVADQRRLAICQAEVIAQLQREATSGHAIQNEREACAQVADNWKRRSHTGRGIAAAIRARGGR